MNQRIQLIASDMDGTSLNDAGILSKRTLEAFQSANSQGIHVVLATGRSPRSVLKALSDSDTTWAPKIAICINGAVVYSVSEKRIISSISIDPTTCRTASELIVSHFPEICFACEIGSEFRCDDGYYTWREKKIYYDVTRCSSQSLFDSGACKIMIHHPTMSSTDVYAALPMALKNGSIGVSLTYSSIDVLDIVKVGVSKGTTLEIYCNEIGVEREHCVAFGDMMNDIEMLTWAGTGIAVENAEPGAKAVAQRITHSNNNEGVAISIEGMLLI